MTENQYRELLSLAEHPSTAALLLSRLERSPRMANALLEVYFVAQLTVHQSLAVAV